MGSKEQKWETQISLPHLPEKKLFRPWGTKFSATKVLFFLGSLKIPWPFRPPMRRAMSDWCPNQRTVPSLVNQLVGVLGAFLPQNLPKDEFSQTGYSHTMESFQSHPFPIPCTTRIPSGISKLKVWVEHVHYYHYYYYDILFLSLFIIIIVSLMIIINDGIIFVIIKYYFEYYY
jgi:hypothetical protein